MINSAPVFNFENPGGPPPTTTGNRFFALGSGIPSSPVPVFLPEKLVYLIGTGGGAKVFDPQIGLPRYRTYWFQQ